MVFISESKFNKELVFAQFFPEEKLSKKKNKSRVEESKQSPKILSIECKEMSRGSKTESEAVLSIGVKK